MYISVCVFCDMYYMIMNVCVWLCVLETYSCVCCKYVHVCAEVITLAKKEKGKVASLSSWMCVYSLN